MMKNNILKILIYPFFPLLLFSCTNNKTLYYCGSKQSEIYQLLIEEGFNLKVFETPELMIEQAKAGSGGIIVCDSYPKIPLHISSNAYEQAKKKNLKLYLEYPDCLPDITIAEKSFHGFLERAVVTQHFDKEGLNPMDILGINDCYTRIASGVNKPLLVLARVAGFDKAEYGIDDVETYPLLSHQNGMLTAFTKLSNFRTGRYGPNASWQVLWEYIISYLTDNPGLNFIKPWPTDVKPMYNAKEALPSDAKTEMISRGTEWFFNGHFFVDESWKEQQLVYQGDGLMPVNRALPPDTKTGDGSLGILEGHASNIYHNGEQDYRYWLRNDVQGEVAFALASAGEFLNKKEYLNVSKNLMEYALERSSFRAGERLNKKSPVYGLIGWSDTHPYVFYADDNARSILGIIGASAFMNMDEWNKIIVENILANLRLTNVNGFFGYGGRHEEPQILKNGLAYYANRDELVNPHPHFESWMWACYLWLYEHTGYELLLDKAKRAIRLTMEAYPDNWKWTNGIQQERARMILPLAWLVRVEDTQEHREWLDRVVQRLLENQEPCGALREELGDSKSGTFGKARSNKGYGVTEAPLIAQNGDPVADMLYTSNFAFFSLNEAARATNNPQYHEAVSKLSDFLTRIQVSSDKYSHLDGAWFRAFDYNRWDYWASNADHGWGAWSTLTGWIQSWIVGTQVLVEKKQSFWEVTQQLDVKKEMQESLWMLADSAYSIRHTHTNPLPNQ